MLIKMLLFILLFCLIPVFAEARLNILTTYPYLAEVTNQIVKGQDEVSSLSKGSTDPHFIVPKPSLIAKARQADLIIANGADLEVGWLPQIIKQANNPKLSNKGFLDVSEHIQLIDVPKELSRHHGDVHPYGNPHFHLDPHNIPIIAEAITKRLCEIQQTNCNHYKENLKEFHHRWNDALKRWDKIGASLKGKKIVQSHTLYNYLIRRYGLQLVGNIEPLPGIPPSSKHLESLINSIKEQKAVLIIQDVYHSDKAARMVSEKTSVPVVLIPHDVGSTKEAKDLYSLFDTIFERLSR